VARLRKSAQSGRGLDRTDSATSDDPFSSADGHPLLSVVVLRESTAEQPTTLVRGNRTLVSLNLSRNDIGPVGMTALLDAVLPLCRDTQPPDPTAPGLLRVAVHGNRGAPAAAGLARARRLTAAAGRDAADVDATARYVGTLMASRDPLLRRQSVGGGRTARSLINVTEA